MGNYFLDYARSFVQGSDMAQKKEEPETPAPNPQPDPEPSPPQPGCY
jgi:hypothetical protein